MPPAAPAATPAPVTPAPAPATPDLSGEVAALQKALAASEKKHAAALAKAQDPATLRAEMAKLLGVATVEDPAAAVTALKTDVARWQSAALKAALRAEGMAVLSDAHNPTRVMALLDTSGVEFDPDTGTLKNGEILKERAAALKTSDPYLFKGTVDPSAPPVTRAPAPVVPAAASGNAVDEYARAVAAGADLKTLRTLKEKAFNSGALRALTG